MTKIHTKQLSFEEEYRRFLIENGIDIDETSHELAILTQGDDYWRVACGK